MIGIVALFSVPVAPAFAGEFQALSSLPDGRRVELAEMSDGQLAAVEGAAFFCSVCIDAAMIRHLNASVRLKHLQSLHRRAAKIRQLKASVALQRLHRHKARIRQAHASVKNVSVKNGTTHQSNTLVVVQRN
jgi:hypothetical protein